MIFIKTLSINVSKKNIQKRLTIWAIIVALILSIPLIAKAPWSPSDFIFAGVVLFGAAAGYEIITGNVRNPMYRYATAFAALGLVILIWAWAVA